jgi:hypothetical protein
MSDKPLTGYGVGNAMLGVMHAQVERLAKRQKGGGTKDITGAVSNLGRSVAALVAELRKSIKDAKDAAEDLSEERQVELVLGLVEGFSPEYRDVIAARIEELGGKLIT